MIYHTYHSLAEKTPLKKCHLWLFLRPKRPKKHTYFFMDELTPVIKNAN